MKGRRKIFHLLFGLALALGSDGAAGKKHDLQ